jgi:hypothetical protein
MLATDHAGQAVGRSGTEIDQISFCVTVGPAGHMVTA